MKLSNNMFNFKMQNKEALLSSEQQVEFLFPITLMHLLGTVKSQWDFTKPGNLTSFVGLFYFWSRLTSNCGPSFLIPLSAGITGLCYLTWLHHLLVLGISLPHSWLTSYPFLWCHNREIHILQQFVDLLFLCLYDTWKSLLSRSSLCFWLGSMS